MQAEKLNPENERRQIATIFNRLSDLAENYSIHAGSRDILDFKVRLINHWEDLYNDLRSLYGESECFQDNLIDLMDLMLRSWSKRPDDLKIHDKLREKNPKWHQSRDTVGGVLYVDLFSRNLRGLHEQIDYFKEIGLTYLHLMPLFAVPHEENDGGYAVSNYRAVNPDLGSFDELSELAVLLRQEGISLVLDFVFNHTSNEHRWAMAARNGDPEHQKFYHIFDTREIPDRYEETLREIFPTVRKGSFTYCQDCSKWVWTTFNSYQWDLNYSNQKVFNAMTEEMLYLANSGVEILRLDAVAFIWKKMGTTCENLPEAHTIIRAFNSIARIAAPSLLFKSEAIVHPDDVIKYIGTDQCQLSYNPMYMALLWEAAATRSVSLLQHAMSKRVTIPDGCSWVNYLRCHDDIGWTFDDNDAWETGINPHDHRKFLNSFYTGRFEGTFSKGLPFQFNPETEDMRVSGTLASLAGLEQALERKDHLLIEMSVLRIAMLRSIIISSAGIPLLYLGDEWGMMNDYTYLHDTSKASDSRWVHRCRNRWSKGDFENSDTIEWRLFHNLQRLIKLRKKLPAMNNGKMTILNSGNDHVYSFTRSNGSQKILVLANFTEAEQRINLKHIHGLERISEAHDHTSENNPVNRENILLTPYQFLWLEIK